LYQNIILIVLICGKKNKDSFLVFQESFWGKDSKALIFTGG